MFALILSTVKVLVTSLYSKPASPANAPLSLYCTCVLLPPGAVAPPPAAINVPSPARTLDTFPSKLIDAILPAPVTFANCMFDKLPPSPLK